MWLYSISNIFIVFLQYTLCCLCSQSNFTTAPSRLKGETGDLKEKRQLHLEEYGSLEFLIDQDPTELDAKRNSSQTFIMTNVTSTEINHIDKEENVTSIELNDITMPVKSLISNLGTTTSVNNVTTTNFNSMIFNYLNNINDTVATSVKTIVKENTTEKQVIEQANPNEICTKYRNVTNFELDKVADVWKITFYTIPTTLKCFRLHIRAVSVEERKQYENTYGDFDSRVNWNNCILEITSNDHKRIESHRKHFLQKSDIYHGVLENIIIDQEHHVGNTTSVLREESPDQWLALKNLLLMRDCNTGDIVVFSRVPSEPLISDIEDALVVFGENGPINGTRACEGFVKAWVKVG